MLELSHIVCHHKRENHRDKVSLNFIEFSTFVAEKTDIKKTEHAKMLKKLNFSSVTLLDSAFQNVGLLDYRSSPQTLHNHFYQSQF